MTPLVLAAMYAKGVEEALEFDDRCSGGHKVDLMKAVAISRLPVEVLQLLEGKIHVVAHGEILLKVHHALGTNMMVDRAKAMLSQQKRRSAEQIISLLVGVRRAVGPVFRS
jgi:hypothetical protein